jgi:hypothetical protein
MIWIDSAIKFTGDLTAMIEGLASRYGVTTDGDHTIDGVSVEFSYAQPHGSVLTVVRDNYPLTRFRRVTVGVSLPIEELEEGALVLRCCFPKTLIDDLQSDPKPEWLEGIEILTP